MTEKIVIKEGNNVYFGRACHFIFVYFKAFLTLIFPIFVYCQIKKTEKISTFLKRAEDPS